MLPEDSQGAVERFRGLAAVYDRCRPDYPAAAVDFVIRQCGLRPGMLLVDVGCGTGISTRQFAARGLRLVGIEPNEEMRRVAEAGSMPAIAVPIIYCSGRAEATGLADACADGILVAQAFHWFAHENALAEFHRILKPGGWVALVWNDQEVDDAFTAEYREALIRHSPAPALAAEVHSHAGATLSQSPLFVEFKYSSFPNEQLLNVEELLGRAFSASYAPREGPAKEHLAGELRELHRRYAQAGHVTLCYRTAVYLARRA